MANFSAWFVSGDPRQRDVWEHGVTASGRRELMRKVERKCRRGYRLKAILWDRQGKSNLRVWDAGRWIKRACHEAFGE